MKRVRDYAEVRHDGVITLDIAKTALDMMNVDKAGLDYTDQKMLRTLITGFGGVP